MQAFDDPEALTEFLTKSNRRPPVNRLKPHAHTSGRGRLRCLGRRFCFPFRVGVLHSKRTQKADVMVRSRSADVLRFEPRELKKLIDLVHSKQVPNVRTWVFGHGSLESNNYFFGMTYFIRTWSARGIFASYGL